MFSKNNFLNVDLFYNFLKNVYVNLTNILINNLLLPLAQIMLQNNHRARLHYCLAAKPLPPVQTEIGKAEDMIQEGFK